MVSSTSRSVLGAWLLALSHILAAAGCDTSNHSAVPAREVSGTAAESLISDESHDQGSVGFLFLPPMVPPPAVYGDFVAGLPVSVRIDELSAKGAVSRSLATFTATGGPRGERLRTHLQGAANEFDDNDGDSDPSGYYYARWLADDEHLSPSARYRVRVLVPARVGQHRELGFADVDVASTEREFRRVDGHEYTPLINGTTLRIKFRVDRRAVDEDGDGVYDWLDNCPHLANVDQVDSLANGVGDTCRCLHITCPARDVCHAVGRCEPTTGQCLESRLPDGQPCPMAHADAICLGGTCQRQACHPHHSDCNGDPFDGCETAITSKENCGGCGNTCPDSPNGPVSCRSGQCVLRCGGGTGDCDGDVTTGCETDTRSDPSNCGSCGNACPNQENCVRGGCTARTCQVGWANCDRVGSNGCETNVSEDALNCGSCGQECGSLSNAIPTCENGECAIGLCNEGFADCNGVIDDGCEVNLFEESMNCGACGNVCAPSNAKGLCSAGACEIASCLSGFTDCDGSSSNGCEAVLASNVANCGTCGAACSVSNGFPQCVDGTCGIATCSGGRADCNGVLVDGCEAQLESDPLNCGACGTVCPSGANTQRTCVGGVCALSCNPGFADCDADLSNGCEADIRDNCGECGNVCHVPNATGQCIDSACQVSVCDPGFADCNGVAEDGCEVDLRKDVANCGRCDQGCNPPNGTGICQSGVCVLQSCSVEFADCNGDCSDGCEVNRLTDNAHCGYCANACESGSQLCWIGLCVSNCNAPGYAVCNGDQRFCRNLTNDMSNCGACNHVCPGGAPCVNGVCTEYLRCGGLPCPNKSGYCIAGTCHQWDIFNCGMPGMPCLPDLPIYERACSQTGQCINLGTDLNNCGALGQACDASATACSSGMCVYGAGGE